MHLTRLIPSSGPQPAGPRPALRSGRPLSVGRITVLMFILSCAVMPSSRVSTLQILSDAYFQVGAYVAATLWVFYWFAASVKTTSRWTSLLLSSDHFQVLFASLMGTLPGCGGAIIVMTQFVKGRMCFGAVVAVLVSTMGDAAFLLIASRPAAGLMVFAVCFVFGLAFGLFTNMIHGSDFLRPQPSGDVSEDIPQCDSPRASFIDEIHGVFWMYALAPMVVIAGFMSLQYDPDTLFSVPPGTTMAFGALVGVCSLTLWAFGTSSPRACKVNHDVDGSSSARFARVARETGNVMCWVLIAFLAFELLMAETATDISQVLGQAPALVIPAAVIIGCIPGCGPQIMVTTLFVTGVIPMSAQIGNALSNDGDALFPALAIAPRAALVATLYSGVPALLAAYGYAFLFE